MKILLLFLFFICAISLSAQSTAVSDTLAPRLRFDPVSEPVGKVADDQFFLTTSEYALVQAIKSGVPEIQKVNRMSKVKYRESWYIVFNCSFDNQGYAFTLALPLIQGNSGLMYAAGQLVVCQGNDCSSCSAPECSCGDASGSCNPQQVNGIGLKKVEFSID